MSNRRRPLVSVILASYNHASFVNEAVKSVLEQTYKNIELIVVDDGSSDGTADVVAQIHDPRLKLVRLPENRAAHSRNIGLKKARGKYVAFQNSDDVWRPKKIETQIDAFEHDKNLIACFTKVGIIDANSKSSTDTWADNVFSSKNMSKEKWLRHFFDKGNALCISSAVIKRRALKKIGYFDEHLFQMSDFDLWVRLASVGNILITPKKLTLMRIISNKNYSYPSPEVNRRTALEYTDVLMHYAELPIADQLDDIFNDFIKGKDLPNSIQLTKLALYASKLGPSHRLFADKVLSNLLSTTKSRQQIYDYFGNYVINELCKKRGMIEVRIHE